MRLLAATIAARPVTTQPIATLTITSPATRSAVATRAALSERAISPSARPAITVHARSAIHARPVGHRSRRRSHPTAGNRVSGARPCVTSGCHWCWRHSTAIADAEVHGATAWGSQTGHHAAATHTHASAVAPVGLRHRDRHLRHVSAAAWPTHRHVQSAARHVAAPIALPGHTGCHARRAKAARHAA